MISLKITDTKAFMNQLLCSELFDRFLISEATITKDASFTIQGRIHPAFYSQEERRTEGLAEVSFLPYARVRPICYQIIRGKYTPVHFRIVLMLSPKQTAGVLARSSCSLTANDIGGIYLNLCFQNGQLNITTGISYAIFTTDRILEQEWDNLARKFLCRHAISFTEE